MRAGFPVRQIHSMCPASRRMRSAQGSIDYSASFAPPRSLSLVVDEDLEPSKPTSPRALPRRRQSQHRSSGRRATRVRPHSEIASAPRRPVVPARVLGFSVGGDTYEGEQAVCVRGTCAQTPIAAHAALESLDGWAKVSEGASQHGGIAGRRPVLCASAALEGPAP